MGEGQGFGSALFFVRDEIRTRSEGGRTSKHSWPLARIHRGVIGRCHGEGFGVGIAVDDVDICEGAEGQEKAHDERGGAESGEAEEFEAGEIRGADEGEGVDCDAAPEGGDVGGIVAEGVGELLAEEEAHLFAVLEAEVAAVEGEGAVVEPAIEFEEGFHALRSEEKMLRARASWRTSCWRENSAWSSCLPSRVRR